MRYTPTNANQIGNTITNNIVRGEHTVTDDQTYDFVIIGSGFGGSVSAMRLTEKGYKVLVLERGKRSQDQDFPRTNWNIFKYLWAPVARCFGILQLSLFRGFFRLGGFSRCEF